MSSFECTPEQLKQMAVEFMKALPTMGEEEATNGLKCFILHYLGCKYAEPPDEVLTVALVKYVNNKYVQKFI